MRKLSDQAIITSHASMSAMPMGIQKISIQSLGQGEYLAQFRFSMEGSWKIDLLEQIDGFDPLQQSLLVQVGSIPSS